MTLLASNQKLVAFYSHVTVWAAIYGILVAHMPNIIGIPWTTCDNCSTKLGCVLLVHLFDGSLTLFNLYVAWFGFKRFSGSTQNLYISLLGSIFAVNLVFFCFEVILIYTNLRSFAPAWENILLATIAVMLIGACGLALYVKQKLIQST
ncbi:MAG TPA: hypothetical protein VIM16_22515 [Mucilaginibacter sp.]|jgi:D-arabinono-1,4-lactone oxidase